MADWISNKDDEFDGLVTKLKDWLNDPANEAASGIDADSLSALNAKATAWSAAFQALKTHYRATAPLVVTKATAHRDLEPLMRGIGTLLRAKLKLGGLTAAQLAAAGMPALDTKPTPAPTPTSKPVIIRIEAAARLQHKIHWRDELTPNSKAKPAGVKRAIFFLKIGNPLPTGPGEMEEVAVATATPYIRSFEEIDAGKPAHWALCWEGKPGQRGPLSAVSTWTIPG